jgi:hypothetical protein
MRALAVTAAVLFSIFGTSYAACGPDGPDNPPSFINCPRPAAPADAGERTVVTLRSGCPADDAPLEINVARQPTTGRFTAYVARGFWVELAESPDVDRCVSADVELPFADGGRRWIPYIGAIDRVPASDGFCVFLGGSDVDGALLGPGATTVRVRVVGATFAGEAEFAANIR